MAIDVAIVKEWAEKRLQQAHCAVGDHAGYTMVLDGELAGTTILRNGPNYRIQPSFDGFLLDLLINGEDILSCDGAQLLPQFFSRIQGEKPLATCPA